VPWRLEIDPRAFKELEAIGKHNAARILKALNRLAVDPYGMPNVKALRGGECYRLRVGDYRAIYVLRGRELLVLVVKVAHRREAYRD
jgi:mRNA interferase RelE/StbE